MKYFFDYSSELSSHLEFDPKAFIGDQQVPQEVCNFILALALAHNDYKFLNVLYNMHLKSKPDGKIERNTVWGEHGGIKNYLIFHHIAFVYELFKLIQENKKVLEDPFLKKVVQNLHKGARKSWDNLIDAALSEEKSIKRSNPFFMIRNKMVYHYDTKELMAGYKLGFFKDDKVIEDACISLGSNLRKVRFYFADKAIEGYLNKAVQGYSGKGLTKDLEDFFVSLMDAMRDTNLALYNICVEFIIKRGITWKNPKKEGKGSILSI